MISGGDGVLQRRLVYEHGGDGGVACAGFAPGTRGEGQHMRKVTHAIARHERDGDALRINPHIAANGREKCLV